MDLTFEHGNAQQPKGHALAYFRSSSDYSAILATYLIVPPVRLDLTKYIPPMFAEKMPEAEAANLSTFAIPPIPEEIDSFEHLVEMAQARDDDLVFAGTVDASRPDSLLLAANEAARRYAQLYAERSQVAAPKQELLVQDVLYSLMGERELLGEIAKLTGKLRYAVEGGDHDSAQDTAQEMRAIARHLHEKYRIEELLEAAQIPGNKGGQLAALYVDRCYRLSSEDYTETARIEAEIKALQNTP